MNILIALDDSEKAMREAVRLASTEGASLTALFVLEAGWSVYTGHDFLLGSDARQEFLDYARDDELRQESELPARLTAIAREAGVDARVIVEPSPATGRVADVLVRHAAGCDVLVMAHPFMRGLEVVRDAHKKLLKDLPCSLYLVKDDSRAPLGS